MKPNSPRHNAGQCIYTIGHSLRTVEEMKRLLRAYGIEVVIDVRRFPKSSKCPHHDREAIEKWLAEAGIKYLWLGEKLGGFRRGGFEAYMSTHDFKSSICELEKIARTKTIVVMCAERFPWKCHRRFIAAELQARGWRIVHIIDEMHLWIPVEKTPPTSDGSPMQQISSSNDPLNPS